MAVEFTLDVPESAFVSASRREIEQIALNLALNAGDRGDRGFTRADLSRGRRTNAVVLRVEDNGIGMSHAMLERVWEPYFTTKSHGSGLGLEIVRSACGPLGRPPRSRERARRGHPVRRLFSVHARRARSLFAGCKQVAEPDLIRVSAHGTQLVGTEYWVE